MAACLDQVLLGLSETKVSSTRAGASKGRQGEPRDRRQKEASPHRRRADTPLPLPRVELFLHHNPF